MMIKLVKTIRSLESTINGNLFFSKRNELLSWSDEGTICLYALEDGSQKLIKQHHTPVTQAFVWKEQFIVSTAYDGQINVWDRKTFSNYKLLENVNRSFLGAQAWDEQRIIAWDAEGDISIWEVENEREISILEQAVMDYYRNSAQPPFLLWQKYDWLVSWGSIELDFWNYLSGAVKISLWEENFNIEGACLLNEDELLSWGTALRIWSPKGVLKRELKGNKKPIRFALVLEEETIIAWDNQHRIYVWTNFLLTLCFEQHKSLLLHVWPINDELLLSKSIDGQHIIWDKKTGDIKNSLQGFSNEGCLLNTSFYLSYQANSIMIWNLKTGEDFILENAHETNIQELLPLDQNRFLSCAKDAERKIWEC